MSDFVKTTNFTAKDGLASGDPNKVTSGAEVDVEFDNIALASATKADKAVPTTANSVALLSVDGNLADSGVTSTELASLNGITATAAELNILDGATVTVSEVNLLGGLTGTVWTSDNDGTGSGLDADLLDGVEGANYARTDQANSLTNRQTISGADQDNTATVYSNTTVTPNFRWAAGTTFDLNVDADGNDTYEVLALAVNDEGKMASGVTDQNIAPYYGKYHGASGVALLLPTGWTSSKLATGQYRITHNLGIASANNVVITATGAAYFPTVPVIVGNYFDIYVYDANGTPVDDVGISFVMYIDLGDANY